MLTKYHITAELLQTLQLFLVPFSPDGSVYGNKEIYYTADAALKVARKWVQEGALTSTYHNPGDFQEVNPIVS
jgi:hypothetical protein